MARRPSRDEIELFDKVVAGAKRTHSNRVGAEPLDLSELQPPPTTKHPSDRKAKAKASNVAKPQQSQKPEKPNHTPHALQDHRGQTAPGIDRRTQLRLKRGQLPIDGRIDLHGMSREAARVALSGFISSQAASGARCVLVITGKGRPDWAERYQPEGREIGVIRRALPGWLKDYPNKDKVLAFSPAQPHDGGAGAWYILLKRRRETGPVGGTR